MEFTFSNVQWNQTSSISWLHGFSLIGFSGNIVSYQFPASRIYASSCTGAACSQSVTTGPGFYYDGTASSSCCVATLNDGNPSNNWGYPNANCGTALNFSFRIQMKNISLIGPDLLLKVRGTSDNLTGCWSQVDLIPSSYLNFQISVSGYSREVILPGCPPGASASIGAGFSAASYQWQASADSLSYVNLSNSGYYSGTNTNTLSLVNIPSSYYGYRYRCSSTGNPGNVLYTLTFKNIWTGTINNDWSNPGNWSCNTVPDQYTDVYINSGNVILGSNTSVRTLTLNPTAVLTVNTGVTLTITH